MSCNHDDKHHYAITHRDTELVVSKCRGSSNDAGTRTGVCCSRNPSLRRTVAGLELARRDHILVRARAMQWHRAPPAAETAVQRFGTPAQLGHLSDGGTGVRGCQRLVLRLLRRSISSTNNVVRLPRAPCCTAWSSTACRFALPAITTDSATNSLSTPSVI